MERVPYKPLLAVDVRSVVSAQTKGVERNWSADTLVADPVRKEIYAIFSQCKLCGFSSIRCVYNACRCQEMWVLLWMRVKVFGAPVDFVL